MSNPWAHMSNRGLVHGQGKGAGGGGVKKLSAAFRSFYSGVLPPQHWFDLTDELTVFQDDSLISLAGEGDFVRGIINKGTDGQPLLESGNNVPIYNLGVVNGHAVLNSPTIGSNTISTLMVNPSGATGLSLAIVARITSMVDTAAQPLMWGNGSSDTWLQAGRPVTGTHWGGQSLNAVYLSASKIPIQNEWVWLYYTIDNTGPVACRTAGLGEATSGFGGFSYIQTVNDTIYLGEFIGQIAEAMIFDAPLTALDKTNLIAGINNYYGTMPF